MIDVQEVIDAWNQYVEGVDDWSAAVNGKTPKLSGCGPIYEFSENPVPDRPNEDFCIADMREISITEPHYHPTDAYEIYFVLQGTGHIVVGDVIDKDIHKGDVLVMEPNNTHYTKPLGGLVIAVVNTPPFRPDLYIPVDTAQSDKVIKFNKARFDELSAS